MEFSVTEAKSQLTDLVRRAEAGEDITLTRHGQVVARIQPVRPTGKVGERRAFLESLRAMAPPKIDGAPTAARSQDFLYDEDGLPG